MTKVWTLLEQSSTGNWVNGWTRSIDRTISDFNKLSISKERWLIAQLETYNTFLVQLVVDCSYLLYQIDSCRIQGWMLSNVRSVWWSVDTFNSISVVQLQTIWYPCTRYTRHNYLYYKFNCVVSNSSVLTRSVNRYSTFSLWRSNVSMATFISWRYQLITQMFWIVPHVVDWNELLMNVLLLKELKEFTK